MIAYVVFHSGNISSKGVLQTVANGCKRLEVFLGPSIFKL